MFTQERVTLNFGRKVKSLGSKPVIQILPIFSENSIFRIPAEEHYD